MVNKTSKRALLLLVGIILLGIVLRSYQLTARSLWFDEAFSWRLIQFSVPELLTRDAADVHPPLYYLILKGWAVIFGTTLLSLRAFSVTCAALSIGAMYIAVKEVLAGSDTYKTSTTTTAALVAALLLAVSPWQIAFAWEARMYTLGTLCILLSTYVLAKAIHQKKSRPLWWILYGLCLAACMYIHYYTFFSIAAQVVWIGMVILLQSRGRIGEIMLSPQTWHALMAGAIALLLFAPWMPTFFRQNAQVQQEYWIPVIGGWTIPDTFYRMIAPTSGIPPHTWPALLITILPGLIIGAGALLVLLIGYAKSANSSWVRSGTWLIVLSAAAPFICSIILSLVSQSLYNDRFFVFSHLFILAGASVVLGYIPSRYFRIIAITTATVGSLVAYTAYWQELDFTGHPGAHGAVQYIFAHRTNEEPVYATSPFIFFPLAHYAKEEFEARVTPQFISQSREISHFAGGPILTSEDITMVSDIEASPTKTIWLLETSGFNSQSLQLSSAWRLRDEKVYPEIFAHQGEVFVRKYSR